MTDDSGAATDSRGETELPMCSAPSPARRRDISLSAAGPAEARAAAVVVRFMEAERRRRPVAMLRLTTHDLVLRFPAESRLLGRSEHPGRLRAVRAMARVLWLTRWSLAVTPRAIHASRDTVWLTAGVTARRKGIDLNITMRFRFSVRGGRISLIEESVDELDLWRRFWGPTSGPGRMRP